MIGIEFKYEVDYANIAYDLLKGLDFDKYNFYIVEDEVIENKKNSL